MDEKQDCDSVINCAYRVYLFRGTSIQKSEIVYAVSDQMAVAELKARSWTQPLELWDRDRIVTRIEP